MNDLVFFKFIEQHHSTNIYADAERDSEYFRHEPSHLDSNKSIKDSKTVIGQTETIAISLRITCFSYWYYPIKNYILTCTTSLRKRDFDELISDMTI